MRLIDADAVIDRYYAEWEYHCIKMDEDDREWLRQCIDQAPTIEAEPVRHGRWVPVDCEHPCDEWDCTACGGRRTFLIEMDADDMEECYPYCPNCGAKMDGGNSDAR